MTKEQLMSAVAAAGSHFFEPETMRFFRSRLCAVAAETDDSVWFVTSECVRSGTRYYTVRRWTRGRADVDTIGELLGYTDRRAALAAARRGAAQGVTP